MTNPVETDAALRALLSVVLDARADENADASSTAGGYLFGDVMSDAVEQAMVAIGVPQPAQQPSIFVDVTVAVEVTDPAALIAAGRQWLIDAHVCYSPEEAAGIITDEDISKALRYLIDPGTGIPGVAVHDSSAIEIGEYEL